LAIIKSRSAQSALLLRVSDRNIPGVPFSIIDYTTVRLVESYSISGGAGEIKGTIRREISSPSPPTERAGRLLRVEQFDDFNNVTDVWPKVHSHSVEQ